MKKKSVYKIILMVALGLQFSVSNLSSPISAFELDDYNLVFFIADGTRGDSLNALNSRFSYFGAKITLASLTETVTLFEGDSKTSDALISDISDITAFDAIIIVHGSSTELLKNDITTLSLLKAADDAGIVIATCDTAILVIAEAGLLSGTKYVCYPTLIDKLEPYGGTYVDTEGYIALTDDNIITSIWYGGLISDIFYSTVFAWGEHLTCCVEYSLGETNNNGYLTNFEINVEEYEAVDNVTLTVSNPNGFKNSILLDQKSSDTWNGTILLENGTYSIDLEIETYLHHLDSLENVKTILIEPEESISAPAFTNFLTVLSLLAITVYYSYKNKIFHK